MSSTVRTFLKQNAPERAAMRPTTGAQRIAQYNNRGLEGSPGRVPP